MDIFWGAKRLIVIVNFVHPVHVKNNYQQKYTRIIMSIKLSKVKADRMER